MQMLGQTRGQVTVLYVNYSMMNVLDAPLTMLLMRDVQVVHISIGIGITDIVMIQQNLPSQSSVLSVQKSH